MSDWGFETRQIHAGAEPDPTTGARAVPIYQTTSFVFRDTEHAAALFGLAELGNIYTRIMNPTQAVFEDRMAALEGGVGALATASGQAAQTIALLNLAENGGHIVVERVALRRHVQPAALHVPEARRRGQLHRRPRRPRRVEEGDPPEHARVLRREHRQPEGRHPRLRGHRRGRARRRRSRSSSTTRSRRPYLCNPLQLRRRHRRALGDEVHRRARHVDRRDHRRRRQVRLRRQRSLRQLHRARPELPRPRVLGAPRAAAPAQYILKARLQYQRDIGAALSPFNSFLFLQGLETLSLRMERHSQNALAVAKWLEARDEVEWVAYPGLASSRWNDRAKKYLPKGQGAIVAFGIKGGLEAGQSFINGLELHQPPRQRRRRPQLAIHPASTTHQQLDVGRAARDRGHARTSCGSRSASSRSTTSSPTSRPGFRAAKGA